MVNYRYLGYGITNEQGIAHLDHDANGDPITHSYTGTGAGKVDIVASLDDNSKISDSSIQSETYEVTDCYKMDNGTSSDHTDIWAVASATLTRGDEYSTIKESTTGTTGIIAIADVPHTDYRIEVDVFQVDGTQSHWALQVMTSSYSPILSQNSILNDWKHISVDMTDVATNSRIRLATGESCTELRFKNFKVYPI